MDWVTLSYRDNNFCALQFTSLITTKGRRLDIHACTTLTLHYDKAFVSLRREQTHVEKKLAEKENYMDGIENQITNLSRMVCFVKIIAFYTTELFWQSIVYWIIEGFRFNIFIDETKLGHFYFPRETFEIEMNTISTVNSNYLL